MLVPFFIWVNRAASLLGNLTFVALFLVYQCIKQASPQKAFSQKFLFSIFRVTRRVTGVANNDRT
ncbi:hypothetical protein CA13_21210 [Planctomycetes bacterium CA13]|uniref:Uncharacterized protein n=1 Tax=Novipirellula herctigrandis TaxID=2527986 RepID=A0A5C5Z027_9BACT|nr:hypothetical protein CA13_21210 [Planctomycetes bacterium CA13]